MELLERSNIFLELLKFQMNDYIRIRNGWKSTCAQYATYDLMVREYVKLIEIYKIVILNEKLE